MGILHKPHKHHINKKSTVHGPLKTQFNSIEGLWQELEVSMIKHLNYLDELEEFSTAESG